MWGGWGVVCDGGGCGEHSQIKLTDPEFDSWLDLLILSTYVNVEILKRFLPLIRCK
jgi:hypothetical protein